MRKGRLSFLHRGPDTSKKLKLSKPLNEDTREVMITYDHQIRTQSLFGQDGGVFSTSHSGVAANKPTRHYRGLKVLISANEPVTAAPFLGPEVL